MKLSVTKEWIQRRSALEGDLEIGAGALAFDPPLDQPAPSTPETHAAFGSLVSLMRRKKGMSREDLAAEAEIDLDDVVRIEDDATFPVEPRTVYQLSRTFGLPNRSLLQLSGNVEARSPAMKEQSFRFAARSGASTGSLTKEELRALEQFVAFLAKD